MGSYYFSDAAKNKIRDAIKEIELQTCAEVVVTVRRRSASYRQADYLWGLIFLIVSLVLILFLPWEFALEAIPAEVLAAFAVGATLSLYLPRMRKLLVSRKAQQEATQGAAKSAFHDLGISNTKSRCGILVFLSLLEKRVEILPDHGIDTAALGSDWDKPVRNALGCDCEQGLNGFVDVLKTLGPTLAKVHPHQDNDVNELPDEVSAS